jgi:DNA-binding IclR family transcriptional regulator
MEEARAVLTRLERIEALDREGAGAAALLAELRELVREATAWAESERDPRARAAAAALAAADREEVAVR